MLEMLVVVAVIAIAAAVALPAAQPVAEARADAAAAEVALALRFARDNALRTGQARLFDCDQARNTIKISGITTGLLASSAAATLAHPASGAPYALALNAAPAGNNMALVSCSFTFTDLSSAATLAFDATGTPQRGIGSALVRAQALRSGTVVLGAGNVRRTIAVDVTGRITIS